MLNIFLISIIRRDGDIFDFTIFEISYTVEGSFLG